MSETETRPGFVVLNGVYHPIGDAQCKLCCHDERASPCEQKGCGGIVHSEVEDEMQTDDDDWVWIHAFRCDQCGSTDVPL